MPNKSTYCCCLSSPDLEVSYTFLKASKNILNVMFKTQSYSGLRRERDEGSKTTLRAVLKRDDLTWERRSGLRLDLDPAGIRGRPPRAASGVDQWNSAKATGE